MPAPTVVRAGPRWQTARMPKLPPTSPAEKPERDSSAAAWAAGNRPLARPCVAPDPSDTGTRIFAQGGTWRMLYSQVPYSQASYIDDVASGRENSQEIFAENGPRVSFAGPDLIERPSLIFEDPVLPAAREKRRIRSEQEALVPRNFERMPENLAQREVPGLVAHPLVGAGRVQVDVGALVGQHQSFPKIARAEVRHDHGDLGIAQCDGVQIDGVRKPHIERRGQPQLLAHADAQDPAVHEHRPPM